MGRVTRRTAPARRPGSAPVLQRALLLLGALGLLGAVGLLWSTPGGCGDAAPPPAEELLARRREAMVREQIAARGVSDPRVLAAMRAVPRHRFVPPELRDRAYADHPLPIGEGQTISQPFIVALMTELAAPPPGGRVLEVGTGSGYQAAVLAELAAEVYSVEILEPLARRAAATLAELGYGSVHVRAGDGYLGWPEAAPFDAILVTAAPDHVPRPLTEQLTIGGRLVIPVGERSQELLLITRTAAGLERRSVVPVRFVPMTGEGARVGR